MPNLHTAMLVWYLPHLVSCEGRCDCACKLETYTMRTENHSQDYLYVNWISEFECQKKVTLWPMWIFSSWWIEMAGSGLGTSIWIHSIIQVVQIFIKYLQFYLGLHELDLLRIAWVIESPTVIAGVIGIDFSWITRSPEAWIVDVSLMTQVPALQPFSWTFLGESPWNCSCHLNIQDRKWRVRGR